MHRKPAPWEIEFRINPDNKTRSTWKITEGAVAERRARLANEILQEAEELGCQLMEVWE